MNRGLFHTKNKRFKIKALKKPGHRPPTNHDYTGGEEFFAHGINLSQDGRRVENIFETIQVEDEDDDRYAAMILGEEGLFESPDSVQFNCEDTSTERKQVNRPFVVYVRLHHLFPLFMGLTCILFAGGSSQGLDSET